MEPTDSEFWTDLLIMVVYVSLAWVTMYLITGPPLERLLQRIRPDSDRHELYRWQDWLMLLWAIVNLIIMIHWFVKYRSMGSV
jgi:hypothetical protein